MTAFTRWLTTAMLALGLAATAAMLGGCPADEDDPADHLEDAAESLQDAAQEAGEAGRQAIEEAGDALEEAGEELEDELD